MKKLNLATEFNGFSTASEEEKLIIKSRVSTFLVEQIQTFLDGSNSPVSGGKFKTSKANGDPSQLFERGTMRSFIDARDASVNTIDVGIFQDAPQVERLKSFNHNVGDTVPERRFIPEKDQNFKRQITTGIQSIINEVVNGG